MATIQLQEMKPVATLTGGPPPLRMYEEIDSGSVTGNKFKKGQLVTLSGGGLMGNVSGYIKHSHSGYSEGKGVVGVAADDAVGTTSSEIGVYLLAEDTIFEANVFHDTSASAVTAATDVGLRYGLGSMSGRSYVNKSVAEGRPLVEVIRIKDAVGDLFGRVEFIPRKYNLS